MNDLLFAYRLYEDNAEGADKGEIQYLVRTSSSHLLELALVNEDGLKREATSQLFAELPDSLADSVALVRAVADGSTAFSRVVWHVRNKATWHYPKPGDKHLRRALADVADFEGSVEFGSTVSSIRNSFADVVFTQFWLHNLDSEDELEALGGFYRELAAATAAAVRIVERLLYEHLRAIGGD